MHFVKFKFDSMFCTQLTVKKYNYFSRLEDNILTALVSFTGHISINNVIYTASGRPFFIVAYQKKLSRA